MEYSQWKSMQDLERLNTASKDLHTFWAHLDIRRHQMETFWESHTVNKKAMYLIKAMSGIQRHLQDLIGQVDSQLGSLNSGSLPSSSPAPKVLTHPTYVPPKQDLWSNRRQGYIVLRDLERYLVKLARDFILLKARHRGGPAAPTGNHAT
ncbi:hypothetical protein SKAU_G00330050 [Synaphobranchus kaupii]|uniref:Ciliary neurotrophic factor n=1 Tax=Synaphobranchus kaupii TaxID=118154 RepID=A0A9Q1EQG5_SYNKA|nr:hypothetical protein SKAU_G00330050 [Synaphobranchus kaupii]